jgi:hypothetical protein
LRSVGQFDRRTPLKHSQPSDGGSPSAATGPAFSVRLAWDSWDGREVLMTARGRLKRVSFAHRVSTLGGGRTSGFHSHTIDIAAEIGENSLQIGVLPKVGYLLIFQGPCENRLF